MYTMGKPANGLPGSIGGRKVKAVQNEEREEMGKGIRGYVMYADCQGKERMVVCTIDLFLKGKLSSTIF